MDIIKPTVIEKRAREESPSDFEFLRQKGIELLQSLSGETWTDYNIHDPGVTILEQLCFAITDLAYRTDFPIEDLLTNLHGKISREDHSFFNKELILTSNPVTINDFRKVILDEVEELDNVWLKPVKSAYSPYFAKGLFKITVQVNKKTAHAFSSQSILEEDIIEKVRSAFLSKRNLCEDCVRDINVLKAQKIHIQSEILIKEHVIPEEVLAGIYNALEIALNRPVNRFTEKELQDKGLNVQQIYAGPLLKNGFIPDSELKPLKKSIDPSELIKVISEVEGVLYVRNISINSADKHIIGKPFTLGKNSFPILELDTSDPGIKLLNDKYRLTIKKSLFETILKKLRSLSKKKISTNFDYAHHKDIAKGKFRNIEEYHSIQNYFPLIYGVGEEGLSESESENKKGKVKQLKAYLLFFEQILANYLSQLSSTGNLFSTSLREKRAYSYHFQPLYNVPHVKELLKSYTNNVFFYKNWDEFREDPENGYMSALRKAQETPEIYRARKNRFLDHLLARFNKKVSTYPVLLYYTAYGNTDAGNKISRELKWKADLLRNLTEMFHDRVKAFDYTKGHTELTGFEKKISALLYIQSNQKKSLAGVFDTGNIALVAEKNQGPFYSQAEAAKVTSVSWAGEDLNLFIGADEIIQMSEMGKLLAGGINQNEAFIFRHQRQDILVHGINISNYRIGPDITNENEFVIIYKAPDEETWKTISRHPTRQTAKKALRRLIAFLKKISIRSEGFHMMEHILLRPELKHRSFGFRFYQAEKKAILENETYLPFDDREKLLGKIMAAAQTNGNASPELSRTGSAVPFKVHRFHGQKRPLILDSPEDLHHAEKYNAELEFKNLLASLNTFKINKTKFFPNFEMHVKLSDNTLLKEDFFNYRMTVVLPKWPARFQNLDFRAFSEDLFKASAPAHIRIRFMWLGVSEMKKFEALYFDWLAMFKNKADYETRNKLSEKLIHFLKDDAFAMTP